MPNSALFLLVCTMIAAFGAGFANTAGMAILCEVFVDPEIRGKQMGYYNAVMAAIGALISYIAGFTAMSGWQGFTYVYYIAIPMLIMTIIFLPNIKPEDRPVEAEAEMGSEDTVAQKGFGIKFWMFFAAMFIFYMVYVPVSTYISVYIAENGVGGTSLAGTCTALGTVGSCICCIFFGFFYGKLKRKLSLIVFAVNGVVILLGMLFPSAAMAVIVSLICGGSYGTLFSFCYAYASEIVPLSNHAVLLRCIENQCCRYRDRYGCGEGSGCGFRSGHHFAGRQNKHQIRKIQSMVICRNPSRNHAVSSVFRAIIFEK